MNLTVAGIGANAATEILFRAQEVLVTRGMPTENGSASRPPTPTASPPENVPMFRKNRDFTLLWSAGAGSALGVHIGLVSYPLIALELTGSSTQAGLLGSLALLVQSAIRLPAGALVDRWDRRNVMIACDTVRIVLAAGLGVSALLGSLTFWVLMAAVALSSACEVVFQPAETAALRRVVPADALPRAVAANEARGHAAAIVGQSLGGTLLGLGKALPFLGQSMGFLVSLFATLLVRTEMRGHGKSEFLLREIAEGVRWTWRQRTLRVILLSGIGINLAFAALTFGVVVMARSEGASAGEIGLIFGMGSVGGMLGGRTGHTDRPSLAPPSRIILGVFWTNSALIGPMILYPNVHVMGVLLACMLFMTPSANAVLIGFQVAVTPDRLQGRVISSMRLIISLGAPLGPGFAGLLAESSGASVALLATNGVMLLVAVGSTCSRTMRQLRPQQT
ncbi:MFS transporter [Nonomuraea salmonea]|uniref:MFS transporter n=1 Tax=Nonomuraea salmonea TaxID=46181 RepID=UPI002FE9FB27